MESDWEADIEKQLDQLHDCVRPWPDAPQQTAGEVPACPVWLREQGAVRPMAPAGVIHLVLGQFRRTEGGETGTYPVSYYRPLSGGRRGGDETWHHYGEKLEEAPTRQQCLDWVSEQTPMTNTKPQ